MATTDNPSAPVEAQPPAPPPTSKSPDLVVPPSPAPTNNSFKRGDDGCKMRDIDRDTPAAPRGGRGAGSKKDKELHRKRSLKNAGYYGEVFSVRETEPRVPKAAGVIAEVRTNVILEDEFSFAASLSRFLAARYSRPESAVVVHLLHSACMITGGSFDATYYLTVTSCVSVSPTCNKRNAALIADWFQTNLGVSPARGFVKFQDPDFANFACGGVTVLDMMETEEKKRTGTTERTEVFRERSVRKSFSKTRGSRRERRERESRESNRSENGLVGGGGLQVVDEAEPVKPLQGETKPEETRPDEKRPGTAKSSKSKMKKKSVFNLFTRG